ncbi:MAG: hypothetical protein JWS12_131 [Candidatus Saccharibacteria bacterium]|nr:hypothetical protein [Candidatus Saccharibacteria bacterium]
MNPKTIKYARGMTPYKTQVCANLSPSGQRGFRYIEFDDKEQMVAEMHKHPIGLVFIIVPAILIIVIILSMSFALAANIHRIDLAGVARATTVRVAVLALGIILSIFIAIVSAIGVIVYRSSVVFLTNEKIAEVLYTSLFNRKTIQLGIGRVEDVTVLQKGILPRMFDFGTLIVETAGETELLKFPYIPKPSQNSQMIIKCHEDSIKQYGN